MTPSSKHKQIQQLFQQASQLHQQRQLEKAAGLYEKILKQQPKHAPSLHYYGVLHHQQNNNSKAIELLQQALNHDSNNATISFNLGVVQQASGDLQQASKSYHKCIKLNPKFAMAYNNLGSCYEFQGETEQASRFYKKAKEVDSNCVPALNNYANILKKKGQLSEAERLYRHALTLEPNHCDALSNLAGVLQRWGKAAEAHEYYAKALKVNPRMSSARSGLLLNLNYRTDLSRQAVFDWHKKLTNNLVAYNTASNNNRINRDKRLRIGYLSPDFTTHSVAYFVLPLFTHHNRQHFHITAFANNLADDDMTMKLKPLVDDWHDISHMSDQQTAELIQQQEIDILVDLAGHTARNRLEVLAQKPSPIQVNYLGYPNTLGLEAMDFRLVDAISDPLNAGNENYHVEKLIRLPNGFLCYTPPEDAPSVASAPLIKNGYITFGSFNNTAKINETVLSAWATILQQTPNSKLMLKSSAFHDEIMRNDYHKFFSQHGIEQHRLQLLGHTNETKDHLAIYNQIDVALDTFPYNGTTTTCEAIWMGVPVITVAGELHASRVGASLLSQLELDDLITGKVEHYVELARRLAEDKEILQLLRYELRPLMEKSSLTDGKGFTENLEKAYREMVHQKGIA